MKRFTILLLLLLAALLNLQCGYRLAGRGRNLPADARTIAIPRFANETPQFQAEHFVTVAIRDEFARRSGLRLVADMDRADMILEGRIRAFETVPVGAGGRGKARASELRITIHVRLLDMKNNESIFEAEGLAFRATYETDAADFFSQPAEALEKIAARLAAGVVTSILDNF